MKLSEPAIAYNSVPLQQLKSRLLETIRVEDDVMKLQQCLELLQGDEEDAEIHKYASIDAIPVETRRLAVDAARSDYQAGECLPQDEIKDWLKERMGWK